MHYICEVLRGRHCLHAVHRAFTLIELLVVIAIIGILSAILLSVFGSSSDSARAALCLTNMRSLAQGVNNYAMKNFCMMCDNYVYPSGGNREKHDDANGLGVVPQHSWVSWLDNKDQYHGGGASSHQTCPVVPYEGTGNYEDDMYAITNGVIWHMCDHNRKLYTCPEFNKYRARHSMKPVLFSYVMSAFFGHDTTQGDGTCLKDGHVAYGKQLTGAPNKRTIKSDRLLMFAELPLFDPETGEPISNEGAADDIYQRDCTLQYKGAVRGCSYGSDWNGEKESIGFVHKTSNGQCCAHVVFADLHTEKLVYPKGDDAGMSLTDLTTALCEGWEVTFDGTSYRVPMDAE